MKLKERVARAIYEDVCRDQGRENPLPFEEDKQGFYESKAQAAMNVIANWLAQDDEYKHLAKQLRSEP